MKGRRPSESTRIPQNLGEGLPGSELIRKGIQDLVRGIETVESLLISIGAPRLRSVGVPVPENAFPSPEHRLYALLSGSGPDSAHGRYNTLLRRLVSFERAAECGRLADEGLIRAFMRALGREAESDCRLYFTGGATAVLLGWRNATICADIRIVPDSDRLLREIPRLKEALGINVELASPSDFIPELPGWEERSPPVAREGKVSFYHYDLYSQALAKLERRHDQDLKDVSEMLTRNLIEPQKALQLFQRIEPQLYRYPAIDPPSFRRAVEGAFGPS